MNTDLQSQLKRSIPFEMLEEEVTLNIQRTHSVLSGPLLGLLKQHNLSPPLYNVLRILRGAGKEGLPCAQIGERMVTRVPDVTRLIDRLEKAGLARRQRFAADRRVVRISVTAAGLKLAGRLDQPMEELHKTMLGHLGSEELSELNRLLVKARGPLEA